MKKGTGNPTPSYSLAAVVVANSTNPTEGGSHEKGKCVNQGTVTNLQAITNPREGEDRAVMENKLPVNKEFISKDPTAHEELPTRSEPIKTRLIEGTYTPKPKWTRILRMDCGPGASKKGELKEILGKMASSQINKEEAVDEVKVHVEKKG